MGSSRTYFSSMTVWPLLRVSSMMIFSSSGRRTWGMESLREPVYKNYSSGRKRETFSDAYAAPETAALNLPAAPEPGASWGQGDSSSHQLSATATCGLIWTTTLGLKRQVESSQECLLYLKLHHDLLINKII